MGWQQFVLPHAFYQQKICLLQQPIPIIDIFLVDLKNYVNNNTLVENEFKLGQALIELFDNYGNIFIGNDNNKFNKNIVLLSLREMTNMNTKEIRIYLKKYKHLYLDTVKKIHNQ